MTDIALSLDEDSPDNTDEIGSTRTELPDAEATPETPQTPTDETQSEPTGDEKPDADATPSSDTEPPKTAPIAAVQAERTQKQAARQESDELRDQVAQLTQALSALQQPKSEAPKEPEALDPELIYTDPQKVIDRITSEFSERLQATEQRNTARLNDITETNAIARYGQDDYTEKLNVFREAANADPSLIAQMQQQPDPAEWAYQQGKSRAVLAEVGGDVGELQKKIEARVRAEIAEEMKAQKAKAEQTLSAVPDAMSEQTTQGSTTAPVRVESVPLALD